MKLLYAEDEISMSEAVVDILTYHHPNPFVWASCWQGFAPCYAAGKSSHRTSFDVATYR